MFDHSRFSKSWPYVPTKAELHNEDAFFDCWTRSILSRVLELRDTVAIASVRPCDERATDCGLVSMTSPPNPNLVQARNPPPHLALPTKLSSPRKTPSSSPGPVTLVLVCRSSLL